MKDGITYREKIEFNLCNLEEIGDEFHYILNCPYFKQYRDIYIKKRYTKRPNIINFLGIMASTNRLNLTNLTVFLCSNIVYILYILYIVVSMSSLYLCHLVIRIKIYIYIKPTNLVTYARGRRTFSFINNYII